MSFSAATAWNVRGADGSDANGGGFVVGATGTDYSKQAAAQIAYTDLVIDGTTNTKCTSAGNPFTSAHVGNTINVTGGTGFTVQRVQVVSVTAGAATVDKSLGTLSSTGGTGNLGGALLTIAKALTLNVTSNIIFIKSGTTYQISANLSMNNSLNMPSRTNPMNRLVGYTTTYGDLGRPTIQLITNSGLTAIDSNSSYGWSIENIIIDCNSLTTSSGIKSFPGWVIQNCKVSNFKSTGISMPFNSPMLIVDTEVTGGITGATAGINNSGVGSVILRCNVHDNVCPGIIADRALCVISCLIYNNTGASSDGISQTDTTGNPGVFYGNVLYANGRDGIRTSGILPCFTIRNNIFVNNGAYGIKGDSGGLGTFASPLWDGNAFYNNTTAARLNMDDTGSTKAINGAAPYTNVLDVILTGDPFTNAAGGDFTLNSTAGAGAACKAVGTPGAMPGVSQTGKLDIGTFQSTGSGGGGGLMYNPSLEGL